MSGQRRPEDPLALGISQRGEATLPRGSREADEESDRGQKADVELPLRLSWRSIRPQENRYRFYTLWVAPDLWGRLCVVRRWGRLTSGSKAKFTWIESDEELHALVRHTHRNRTLHGYRLTQGDLSRFW